MESNMNRIVAAHQPAQGSDTARWRIGIIAVAMAWIMPLMSLVPLVPLMLVTPAMAQTSEPFYDGLGGEAGIKKIVDTFLAIILVDPRIAHQFKELDQPHFVAKLAEQFCHLSGGPCQYTGKDMKDIHDGMNITNAQFNALAEDLQYAMEQHGIPNRIQNKLVAKLAPMQRVIVTK